MFYVGPRNSAGLMTWNPPTPHRRMGAK